MKKLLFVLLTTIIYLTGCRRQPDEVDFMILYTSQTYGNSLPWDFRNDSSSQVSLANFMSLVREQRAIYGDRCIVLDNGNMHTRGLCNFYWRYIDTICEPFTYKAQRYVGYDAVALGHSDLRLREPFMAQRHDTTLCPPTICMNLIDSRTGKPYFRPWVCLERDGLRIAVFSLVDERADGWTPSIGHPDVECEEMVSALRDQIMLMRHHCKPDLVIGLVSSPREPEELHLQEQIPGIDYLIGINLHDLPDVRQNNYAGMVRVIMTRDSRTNTYSKQFFRTSADLSQYEADEAYTKHFENDIQTLRAEYSKQFGMIPEQINTTFGIYSPHDRYRDILHQAQLWYSGADVSLANIANSNVIGQTDLMPGPMTITRLTDIFAHENLLVTFRTTGTELKEILESFYEQEYNVMKSPDDPFLAVGHDCKGHPLYNSKGQPYLNMKPSQFTSGAGLKYSVDLRRPGGSRISIHGFNNGKAYHPDSMYVITTNSYIASGMGNSKYIPFLDWDENEIRERIVDYGMPSITYVLYKYFHDCPQAYTLHEEYDCNFIPEDWWRKAMAREVENLNPTW